MLHCLALLFVLAPLISALDCDAKCPENFCSAGNCVCPPWLSGFFCEVKQTLKWAPCVFKIPTVKRDIGPSFAMPFPQSLPSLDALHSDAGASASTVECATVRVPLSYENISYMSSALNLTVMRYLLGDSTGTQTWEIAGGPGEKAIETLGPAAHVLAQRYKSDVYAFNIRGSEINITGDFIPGDGTTAETLKKFYESQIEKNVALLEYLPYLTTTNIAHDMKFLIELFESAPKSKIFLNGHSYGTYVANRFAQLFPDVADGIISDGTCFGETMKLMDWDVYGQRWYTEIILQKCKEDAFCSSYISTNPSTFVNDSLHMIAEGRCKDIVKDMGGLNVIKYFFTNGLPTGNIVQEFGFPLMMLYRLRNCAFYDRWFFEAVRGVKSAFKDMYDLIERFTTNVRLAQDSTDKMNYFLNYHMKVGELARWPIPTLATLEKELNQYPIGTYTKQNPAYKAKNGSLNFYPWTPVNAQLDNGYGNQGVKTRWLFISGEIDRNTPLFFAQEAVKHFPNATHFIVKNGPHVSGLFTPCGIDAAARFIASGGTDVSFLPCAMDPINFRGTAFMLNLFQIEYAQDYWSPWVVLPTTYFGLTIGCVSLIILIIIVTTIVYVIRKRMMRKRDAATDAEIAEFGQFDTDREPLMNVH